jgi:anti-sigma regulatory factor (Ser/Thr protein kinase)
MKVDTIFRQVFQIKGGDFIKGGDASCEIGNILKDVGIDPDLILRLTVAAYEAEMNVVIYARKGTLELILSKNQIILNIEDKGVGIKDIDLAMQEGYSTASDEIRELGFGAGMGLPNIKKNADKFNISSVVGKGTKLKIIVNIPGKND